MQPTRDVTMHRSFGPPALRRPSFFDIAFENALAFVKKLFKELAIMFGGVTTKHISDLIFKQSDKGNIFKASRDEDEERNKAYGNNYGNRNARTSYTGYSNYSSTNREVANASFPGFDY